MRLHQLLFNCLYNFYSININRNVIIIESDDWGSLRTETLSQRSKLNKISLVVQNDPYIQLDGLAEEDDLIALFEMLTSIKNIEGKSPILTANICTANPDFHKIRKDAFERFYYEPFFETIEKKKNGTKILQIWKEGQTENIFYPQLHGREHLHALAWLEELRRGNSALLKAFQLESWGIPYQAIFKQKRSNLQAALDMYELPNEEEFHFTWLRDSAKIFEDYFGFKSKTFISPAYVWDTKINHILHEIGVHSIQGIKLQFQPKRNGYKRKLHFMGEMDRKHQIRYFPRNVFYEPALQPHKDWYSETMKGIQKAFANKQPAIISSHRLNFIGKLNEKNRTRNLTCLKTIFDKVINLYPDVTFASSDTLFDIINNNH